MERLPIGEGWSWGGHSEGRGGDGGQEVRIAKCEPLGGLIVCLPKYEMILCHHIVIASRVIKEAKIYTLAETNSGTIILHYIK